MGRGRATARARSLIAQHPEHSAFILEAARYLWQKDIGRAFALVFPGAKVPSRSAINRYLLASSGAGIAFGDLMEPADFAARWLRTASSRETPDNPG